MTTIKCRKEDCDLWYYRFTFTTLVSVCTHLSWGKGSSQFGWLKRATLIILNRDPMVCPTTALKRETAKQLRRECQGHANPLQRSSLLKFAFLLLVTRVQVNYIQRIQTSEHLFYTSYKYGVNTT